jgi:iron complex outermembrane receptor protein
MRYLFLMLPFFCCNFIVDGQFSIHGVVSNEKAEKLSFATVFIENSPYAASTDEKGHFIIRNIPPGNYRVKATFIGYQAYISQILVDGDILLNIQLKGEIYNLDQIEIQANRVGDSGPFTHQNMQKKLLQKENLGQDVPFLLQWTPSMVVTSDGGTGIGYTGLRLRGSDQTRINVTINGVPLNDAESQNVFWVDLPDLMGSVNNIQIQRGVGTSTNGSGAFGGTVSINTADTRVNPYIDLAGTMGAFNTRKLSVSLGTGLINDRYLIDGRYSIIKSDGYVDRASADLHSIAFSAARITGRSSLRLNVLSGKEKTYQAWYGVPEAKVKGDDIGLLNHYYNNLGSIYKSNADSINLFSSDRRFNYYTHPGQVDDYRQTHVQLLHSLSIHKNLKTKLTMYYTKGKGFFEEFKYNEKLANYNIASFNDSIGNIIDRTDIVRRRWLDNDLVGILADAEYSVK